MAERLQQIDYRQEHVCGLPLRTGEICTFGTRNRGIMALHRRRELHVGPGARNNHARGVNGMFRCGVVLANGTRCMFQSGNMRALRMHQQNHLRGMNRVHQHIAAAIPQNDALQIENMLVNLVIRNE